MPISRSPKQAGESAECEDCHEALIFLRHEKTQADGSPGKIAPITVATYPNGNIVEMPGNRYRAFGGANLARERSNGTPMRLNHFANCPGAGKFHRS